MTTMTIHADDVFAEAMRTYAAELGKSVNQTVKDVFAPILGLVHTTDKVNAWARFDGALPEIDERMWSKEISSHRVIDAEMWK